MTTRKMFSNSTLLNFSAPQTFEYVREPLSLEIFRLALEVLIALCGVIGNVLVCHVVTRSKKLHSVANFHIRNLAIADLGV